MWNDVLEDCSDSMDVLKAFPKLVFDPQHMFEKPTGCELGDVSHRHRREFLGHELDTRGIDLLSVAWIFHSTVGSRIRRPWAVLSLFLTSFVRLALLTSSLRSFIAFGVPRVSRCYGWSRVERR